MLMEMIPVDAGVFRDQIKRASGPLQWGIELPPTSTAITAFSLQDEDRMVEFCKLQSLTARENVLTRAPSQLRSDGTRRRPPPNTLHGWLAKMRGTLTGNEELRTRVGLPHQALENLRH